MRAKTVLLAIACSVGAPSLCAQQVASPVARLKITTAAELSLSHQTVMIGRAMCDDAGNVYTRQLTSEASRDKRNLYRLPIQKMTPNGEVAGNFRVTDAFPDDVVGQAVFVNGEGRVYQVALAHESLYVVEFAPNGSIKTKTKLEVDPHLVSPRHLTVFRSGAFLLIGETGKDARTPFTAVFDMDGRLVKKIYESEDEDARRKAEQGDPDYAHSNLGNWFVSSGDAAVGSDGNAYLLRGTSPTLVYVISPRRRCGSQVTN